jgi:hypothetical protein
VCEKNLPCCINIDTVTNVNDVASHFVRREVLRERVFAQHVIAVDPRGV